MSSLTAQHDASPVATNDARWSVLIVDDHPLFRNGLRELFRNDLNVQVAGEAETEEDAYEQIIRLKPDLVTVDVSLAAGNGLNLIARIKKDSPKTAVLVISMFEDREKLRRGMSAMDKLPDPAPEAGGRRVAVDVYEVALAFER